MLGGVPSVRVRDLEIHYLDQGEGVPVVLVHSSGMSSRQWSRIAARLGPDRRVVAPDLIGSGKSEGVPHDAPFHFSWDVEAVEAVLATLGESPYHLVGHSYGGLLALTVARRHPERVLSLCLYEPVAFGVLYSEGDRAGIASLEDYDPDGTFLQDEGGGAEPWMERFIDWWQGPGAWRGLSEPAQSAFLGVGRKVFQEVRSLLLDRTPLEAYAKLTMPALLLSGAHSPLAARRVCELFARALPNARLHTFEDAGHMGPLTHGPLVAAELLDHLRAAEGG